MKQQNFLEFTPVKNPSYPWELNDNGFAVIIIPRKSLLDRIAQIVFFRPAQTRVELDATGTFIWGQIDGENNILQIAALLEDSLGVNCHPLLERLIVFVRLLRENRIILWRETTHTP